MKVIKSLNISAEYFYDRVIESVLYDISEQTGQNISPDKIVGFEYKKSFGNYPPVKIKIIAAELSKLYEFTTATSKNTFTTSYEIAAAGEKSCQVCYRETVASEGGTVQTLNDKLAESILSFLKKRRIKKLLQAIESSAL